VGYYLPSLRDSAPFAPFVHLKLLLAAAADIILAVKMREYNVMGEKRSPFLGVGEVAIAAMTGGKARPQADFIPFRAKTPWPICGAMPTPP
jgi:hypothetical protein